MWKKYDDEFKRQAVKKVFDGQTVSSVSRELGVNESLSHKWKRAALDKGDGRLSGAELSREAELKKRIRELEQENEILKKAALIFGRGS
ncbi:transposase [soil metagenome]